MEGAQYNFDADFQETIVGNMLYGENFLKLTSHLIKPEYFHDVTHGAITEIIQDYYDKYKQAPTEGVVRKEITDRTANGSIREDLKEELYLLLESTKQVGMSANAYTADCVLEFAKQQAMELSVIEYAELVEKGEHEQAVQVVAEAGKTDFNNGEEGYDFYAKVDERTEYRRQMEEGEVKPRGISTGYAAMDKRLYHNGYGRKEVTMYAGFLKSGKSVMLADAVKNASMLGYNALAVTMEVDKEIYSSRIDSNISGSPILTLNKKEAYENVQRRVKEAGIKAGKLMIHEYPTKSFSTNMLEVLLENYLMEGLKFDIVALDYLDLFKPNRFFKDDPIKEGTETIEDLRRLAAVYDSAFVTATQLNREGGRSQTATAIHLANNIETGRIADLVITINKDDKEKEDEEMRLYYAASRNQGDGFSIKVKTDLSRMRPITDVLKVPEQ